MQKHSSKRDAIYGVLTATRDHPTADMIYERVKKIYPDMSLATVYRNLATLCENGMIIKIGASGKERYDADVSVHTHFFCEKCGEVCDIFSPLDISGIENAEKEITGKINLASITFRGICERCLDK